MQIKEVAEQTGVTIKAIRYYEKLGLLGPERSEIGEQNYKDTDIQRVLQIKNFRLQGLTIAEITQSLSEKTEKMDRQKDSAQKQLDQKQDQLISDQIRKQKKMIHTNLIFGIVNVLLCFCMLVVYSLISYRLSNDGVNLILLAGIGILVGYRQLYNYRMRKEEGQFILERRLSDYTLTITGNACSYLLAFGLISSCWNSMIRGYGDWLTKAGNILIIMAVVVLLLAILAVCFMDSRKQDLEFNN